MLGEVVKFILTIAAIIEWFFKPRPLTPLTAPRPYSPAEQRHWRGYVIDKMPIINGNVYVGKNPAYKSSNGF